MRREFTKPVRVTIVKRATDSKGVTRCEECHAITRDFEIHHITPDAMEIDKTKPLKAHEGILLCRPCHAEHTKKDVPAIAKAKRRESQHLGIAKKTALAGRDRQQIDADKAERGRARGAKERLPPRMLRGFVSATDYRK